jgi:hypothetical protein
MNTKDLRIGYYYNYKGSPIQLDQDTLASILQTGGEYNYSPIPLTEEWLTKFGFKPYGDGFHKGHFWIGPHHKIAWYGKSEIIECQYIHSLQNLYSALTGKELNLPQ